MRMIEVIQGHSRFRQASVEPLGPTGKSLFYADMGNIIEGYER